MANQPKDDLMTNVKDYQDGLFQEIIKSQRSTTSKMSPTKKSAECYNFLYEKLDIQPVYRRFKGTINFYTKNPPSFYLQIT